MNKKGLFYESKASEFLKIKGYQIIKRNFRSRFGEIDVIARKNKEISFIEVKERRVGSLSSGREGIDYHKCNRIKKTALFYIRKISSCNNYNFSVVEITQGKNWRQYIFLKRAFNFDEEI